MHNKPALSVTLRPVLGDRLWGDYIDVCLVWECFEKQKGEAILFHVLSRSGVPTQQYTADAIEVFKEEGSEELHLYAKDEKQRNFHIEQSISAGRLVANYRAFPTQVDEHTRCGPQIALENEDTGMSAGGMGFIARPADDEVYDITIDWNLKSTPPGTRGICSFGEGRVTATEKAEVLDECFFMVGAVKSYPQDESPFGLFWLDEPSFDTLALGKRLETILPPTMRFFDDDDPTFRIFIRRNTHKCRSGRGLNRGFVFGWTRIATWDDRTVTEFLFHEIVHNWPRLGLTGSSDDLIDGWFSEGIADYYSLLLPFRFGVYSENEFVRKFNEMLSGYYTNPDRDMPNTEVPDKFWKPGHANRIPYQRGFMYFVQLAYQLHQAGKRLLDDLILEMVHRRAADDKYGINVWLSMVQEALGPKALDDYRDMSEARLIVLPEDVLGVSIENGGAKWTLRRQDQEEFYLGFPEKCLAASPRVVKDLDPESRAAEAGASEGDEVTARYSFLYEAEKWDNTFWMIVKRGEGLLKLSWWSRTWKKVESYQFSPL